MIVAIVLADRVTPLIDGKPVYFLPLDKETIIERIARVVLRGPFGGVVVASDTSIHSEMKETLSGFAVQHLEVKSSDKNGTVPQELQFAQNFRTRWEKAMSAAAERFSEEKSKKPARGKESSADWSRHRKSPDVKVRGLARSFERDGVMLFRGERPAITPELQARIVEEFARDASQKSRPIVQPLFNGVRGYPILFDLTVAKESEALPPATNFDTWLLNQLPKIQDLVVDEAGALDSIESAADYSRLAGR